MGDVTRPGAPPRPRPDQVEVHLVPLRRRHLRSVLKIEAQVYPRPWSLTLFMSELNLRSTRRYVAARVDGVVVGYGGLMFSTDEAHVTTLAVDPAWHRNQIGTRLLHCLTQAALAHGARHMTLEVRMTNQPAQALYQQFGFETAGVRKNYYAEINEDALIMWVHDIDAPEHAARLAALAAKVAGTTVDETVDAVGP
jgi:ribosomal-protein-alanine N-acetyltransferase